MPAAAAAANGGGSGRGGGLRFGLRFGLAEIVRAGWGRADRKRAQVAKRVQYSNEIPIVPIYSYNFSSETTTKGPRLG